MDSSIKPKSSQEALTATQDSKLTEQEAKGESAKKTNWRHWNDLPVELKIASLNNLVSPADAARFGMTDALNQKLTHNLDTWKQSGVKPSKTLTGETLWTKFNHQVGLLTPQVQGALHALKKPLNIFSSTDVEDFSEALSFITEKLDEAQTEATIKQPLVQLMHVLITEASNVAEMAGVELPLSVEVKSVYANAIDEIMAEVTELAKAYHGDVLSTKDGYKAKQMVYLFEEVITYANQLNVPIPHLLPADKLKSAYVDAMNEDIDSAQRTVSLPSSVAMIAYLESAAKWARHADMHLPKLDVRGMSARTKDAYREFLLTQKLQSSIRGG